SKPRDRVDDMGLGRWKIPKQEDVIGPPPQLLEIGRKALGILPRSDIGRRASGIVVDPDQDGPVIGGRNAARLPSSRLFRVVLIDPGAARTRHVSGCRVRPVTGTVPIRRDGEKTRKAPRPFG